MGEAIFTGFSGPSQPGVAVILLAYNEGETIVESLQSFLNLDYSDLEIIVVNDGSTDDTLEQLREAFDLRPPARGMADDLPAEPVRAVFQSHRHDQLLVVDKENGGKSDALNAGLWLTDQPLFCAVDSDTTIERWALAALVQPFVDHEETIATGGTVRVANGHTFEDGTLMDVDRSARLLVLLQVVEYLRAFYLGRYALAQVRSLLLISGAFGVFRRRVPRNAGVSMRGAVIRDIRLDPAEAT